MGPLDQANDRKTARELGGIARSEGVQLAPALDPELMEMVGADTPVGDPRTVKLMRAWTEGWLEHNDTIGVLVRLHRLAEAVATDETGRVWWESIPLNNLEGEIDRHLEALERLLAPPK